MKTLYLPFGGLNVKSITGFNRRKSPTILKLLSDKKIKGCWSCNNIDVPLHDAWYCGLDEFSACCSLQMIWFQGIDVIGR